MSAFISGRLEARGLAASSADVRGLENFLIYTNRPQCESNRRRPASSYSSTTKSSFPIHNRNHYNYYNNNNNNNNNNEDDERAPSVQTTVRNTTPLSSTTPALLLRYLNPKEMKLDLNGNELDSATASMPHNGFINSHARSTRPYRTAQSAGPARQSTKRQMAVQCGIKTIPFDGRRWKNESNTTVSSSTGKGQIVFQGPQNGNQSRRGLRGSKVRPGASTPRPASNARHHNSESLEPSLGYRETSVISSPSPRNLSVSSLQHSQTSLNGPVADGEDGPDSLGGYGWNGSDQGLRLKKHLSAKSSTRSMRRVSEMVHHRIDPMYKINGSKVTLQDRYCVDGVEMQKLQEMTITREELLSDLRKMKFNHNPASHSSQMNSQKHRLLQQNITRLHQQGNSSIYPPTPASEFVSARTTTTTNNNNNNSNDNENDNDNHKHNNNDKTGGQKQPYQQSEEDNIDDIIDDDDGREDEDDDEFDINREDAKGE